MSPRAGTWREEARRLKGTATCSQIAERLGVHPGTVSKFFEQDRGDKPIDLTGRLSDTAFIEPHVYRTPRRIDMGPIVTAAWSAVEARRASA